MAGHPCGVCRVPHADGRIARFAAIERGFMRNVVAAALFVSVAALHAQAPDPQTESVWSCPVHAIVNEQNPGRCPICRRELVLVTATVTWTCAGHPEIDRAVA